jgi:hypothetical protein
LDAESPGCYNVKTDNGAIVDIQALSYAGEHFPAKEVRMSDFYEEAAMPYNPDETAPESASIGSVEAVKNNHARELMEIDGVEGVGIGKDRIGRDAIMVYLRDEATKSRIPSELDGFPVTTQITGLIDAYRSK